MIALTDKQQESLEAITHDLMLLSMCSGQLTSTMVCAVLTQLYRGLLNATVEEAIQASERASEQIKTVFEPASTGLH